MSNLEEIAARESKLNAAKEALLKYIEARQWIDRDRYRRLVARLRKAQAEFFKASSELDGY